MALILFCWSVSSYSKQLYMLSLFLKTPCLHHNEDHLCSNQSCHPWSWLKTWGTQMLPTHHPRNPTLLAGTDFFDLVLQITCVQNEVHVVSVWWIVMICGTSRLGSCYSLHVKFRMKITQNQCDHRSCRKVFIEYQTEVCLYESLFFLVVFEPMAIEFLFWNRHCCVGEQPIMVEHSHGRWFSFFSVVLSTVVAWVRLITPILTRVKARCPCWLSRLVAQLTGLEWVVVRPQAFQVGPTELSWISMLCRYNVGCGPFWWSNLLFTLYKKQERCLQGKSMFWAHIAVFFAFWSLLQLPFSLLMLSNIGSYGYWGCTVAQPLSRWSLICPLLRWTRLLHRVSIPACNPTAFIKIVASPFTTSVYFGCVDVCRV